MKVLRELLNVLIGIVVMVCLLVGPLSIAASINHGRAQDINEAFITNGILGLSLLIAYFLNKPNGNKVIQKFYNAKWLSALATIFVTVFCLVTLFVANLVVGLSVSFGVLVLVLKFFVGRLWQCSACQNRLPYLLKGKSGFSIKECPNCGVELTKA